MAQNRTNTQDGSAPGAPTPQAASPEQQTAQALAEKEARIHELETINAKLSKDLADRDKKIATQAEELNVAAQVTDDLKKKIVDVQAKSEKSDKTLKAGNKKYKLLYPVRHKGELVTEEILSKNESILAELIASGSGALREVK